MVYYFIDFKDWVAEEFFHSHGWTIDQVKFVGRNFYLVVFAKESHQNMALEEAPWYMDWKFMYTVA